jgi:hypothetical protein
MTVSVRRRRCKYRGRYTENIHVYVSHCEITHDTDLDGVRRKYTGGKSFLDGGKKGHTKTMMSRKVDSLGTLKLVYTQDGRFGRTRRIKNQGRG